MAISSVPTHSSVSASQQEQEQEIWGSRVGPLVFIFNLLTIQSRLERRAFKDACEGLSSLCSLMWKGFHHHCEKHHPGILGEYIKKMTMMKLEMMMVMMKLGRRYV